MEFYERFFYDNVPETVVNYLILLALLFIPIVVALRASQKRIALAFVPLVFILLSVVQIMLWLPFNARGISLIWAGLSGCSISLTADFSVRKRGLDYFLLMVAIVAYAAAVIYYGWECPTCFMMHVAHTASSAAIIGSYFLARKALIRPAKKSEAPVE
jgi:hypothetical protein